MVLVIANTAMKDLYTQPMENISVQYARAKTGALIATVPANAQSAKAKVNIRLNNNDTSKCDCKQNTHICLQSHFLRYSEILSK